MRELSILIPARNEMFLRRTVLDILTNIKADTEIIVVLDGEWSDPPMPEDERVTVVKLNKSIGQRAATNLACRLSHAKYVMKCDAHCAFDEGFDAKMIAEMHDDWTMVPRMYNLHAFDWLCQSCGDRTYQGPTPEKCGKCGGKMERDVVWQPRLSRKSDFYRFDKELHFQYWGEYGKRPEAQGEIADTMCLLGACWMLTREKYWELNICDEEHGSWGQQGVEVSCKTWLSGGRLVVNKKTWFSHMFRTQGGDFGFPYPLSGHAVDHARRYSRDLWLNGKWPKAIHDIQWLLDKFKPVPEWHKTESKGIIYYTDNQLNLHIAHACKKRIKAAKLPIVSASLKPMTDMGKNIHVPLERGYLAYFTQILTALENSTADIIFFCEHDWLYHPSHFDFVPPRKDTYYYNDNWWRLRWADGFAVRYEAHLLPGICAYRELLLAHYRKRLDMFKAGVPVMRMGFEPGTHHRPERVDDYGCAGWKSEYPIIDIRHTSNLTASKWTTDDFRSQQNCKDWEELQPGGIIPGWGKTTDIIKY